MKFLCDMTFFIIMPSNERKCFGLFDLNVWPSREYVSNTFIYAFLSTSERQRIHRNPTASHHTLVTLTVCHRCAWVGRIHPDIEYIPFLRFEFDYSQKLLKMHHIQISMDAICLLSQSVSYFPCNFLSFGSVLQCGRVTIFMK